jgi:hypothetical protein
LNTHSVRGNRSSSAKRRNRYFSLDQMHENDNNQAVREDSRFRQKVTRICGDPVSGISTHLAQKFVLTWASHRVEWLETSQPVVGLHTHSASSFASQELGRSPTRAPAIDCPPLSATSNVETRPSASTTMSKQYEKWPAVNTSGRNR